MDFLNGRIKPMYFKYLSAAFGSAMISSIYSIVDTAMVGQYHGPEGTAATAFFGVFWTALSMACPNVYIRIFMSPTAEILDMAPAIIRTYALSFLLLPFNIFSTYYFQAILRPAAAFVVSVARGLVISGLLILTLPARCCRSVQTADKTVKTKGLSLRGPKGAAARPRNDKSGSLEPMNLCRKTAAALCRTAAVFAHFIADICFQVWSRPEAYSGRYENA